MASWPDSGSHTARHRGLSRSYLRDSRKLLDVELACFTLQRADRITRAAVTDVLDTITKPSTFNSAISVGSVVFNLAISRGKHEGINPFAGREKRKSQPRERVLTPSEMRTLWHTAEPSRMYDIGRIVRLLLLTGARPCEIGGLQLSEVDRAGSLLRIPAARMKARRGHPIPLLPAALDLLPQERAGFPNVFGLRPGRRLLWLEQRQEAARQSARRHGAMDILQPPQDRRDRDG